MKNLKTCNGKIICPWCNGNGLIYKAIIKGLERILFVCNECEATWESYETIEVDTRIDLRTYLESSGVKYDEVSSLDKDYNWINDLELKVNENYYDCPLLNIMIWLGDCYDINAVRHVMVKKSILKALEEELSVPISIETAEKICVECKYSF
ncbi:hypothetical protein [Paenibacillus sp. MABNR03]|uniref:hypothetical protein n=1 Tax=Paenibacillus sp. MABNR03 TaxID=3142626 RepID=UPI003D26E0C9